MDEEKLKYLKSIMKRTTALERHEKITDIMERSTYFDIPELREKITNVIKIPGMRKLTMDIAREQEQEETEQKALRDEEVALRLEDVEKIMFKLQKEIRSIKDSQFADHKMLCKLTDKFEAEFQDLKRSESNLLESRESFYQLLRNNLSIIDEVNLFYVQEKPDIVYITVVYDDSAENYTEVEMKIFDVFEESTKEFLSMNAEILVLVNMDNFECPQDANVILKR